MNRGYNSPGVDIFRDEDIILTQAAGKVIYGIVGVTTKGPYGYHEVTSIKMLHDLYGYAYLGNDTSGKRIISDAIIAAERVLTNADLIVFSRVALATAEEAKLVRTTVDMLQFTIANKDTTLTSVTVHHDGTKVTVTAGNKTVEGTVATRELCVVTTEDELKRALEYDGTLINVTVPTGYFDRIKPTEETTGEGADAVTEVVYHDDVYAPNISATTVSLTDEIAAYSNSEAVNVQVLAAPMGSVIELGLATLEAKIAAYEVVNRKLLEAVRSRGSDQNSSDCVCLFDYPKGLKYTEAHSLFSSAWYRGVDEAEALVAYPAVQVASIYTGDTVELGSSGIWLDRMSYVDTKMYPWIAPAGYGSNKGVITGAISINDVLDKDKRDTLYELKINPVIKFVGRGIVLFGNRTFKEATPYQDPSYFEKVNVVRLCNYITRIAFDVSLGILFDPNDRTTWEQWTATMTTEMGKIKENRGVEKFKVKMDEETVTEEDRLLGRAPGVIYIWPVGASEYISIHFTVTNNKEVYGGEV